MDQLIQVFSYLLLYLDLLFILVDDGIARGNDALTLLENRSTYTFFIHELHRVSSIIFEIRNQFISFKLQSFLKQRLNEYHVNETILMTFIMQNAPTSIQKINENGKRKFLLKDKLIIWI
jgi:hypothetical protein